MPLSKRHPLWGGAWTLILSCGAWAADGPRELTLTGALALAHERSPSVTAGEAAVEEARGAWRAARLLVAQNPQIQVASPPTGQPVLAELEITQTLGVTGQRFARARAGREGMEAAAADAGDVRRRVELEVTLAFYDALAAEERVEVATADAELARALLEVTTKRVERGADAPLAVEIARLRAAEAERRRMHAEADRGAAVLRLEEAIGVAPSGETDPVGALPSASALPSVDELVARALEARPDLRGLQDRVEAAEAERRLAVASTFPTVNVGARFEHPTYGNGWLALVGVSPPLFDPNGGERARTRAAETRAEADLTAARFAVEAEVRAAWQRWDAARRAVELYGAEVLVALDESRRILALAYEEGKLDPTEVAVARRERLESVLGNIDARVDLATAEAELRAGAALPITGTLGVTP